MLAATNAMKMSGSEKKVNENTYDISSIKSVTKKFLKKVCCTCKVALIFPN